MNSSLRQHGLSVVVAAFFLLLATGSKKSTRRADGSNADPNVAVVKAYHDKLGAVHDATAALVATSPRGKACDGAKMLRTAAQKKTTNRLRLHTVYGPSLARFSATKTDPNEADAHASWSWLTDREARAKPEMWESYQLAEEVKNIREDYLAVRYLIVIWPALDHANRLPVFDRKTKTYTGGAFDGWVAIVDQEDASVACQQQLHVTSSDDISFRTGGRRLGKLFNEDPEKAVKNDFEDNMQAALETFVPQQVTITTRFGGVF